MHSLGREEDFYYKPKIYQTNKVNKAQSIMTIPNKTELAIEGQL